ncbi:hypothetical protein [Sorangium sp. So ce204]|uniref:hypothetical protein n=1 Tax=Sorangium sp. So ce204 TaxID=3133288 RepID=UPI003F5F20CE
MSNQANATTIAAAGRRADSVQGEARGARLAARPAQAARGGIAEFAAAHLR